MKKHHLSQHVFLLALGLSACRTSVQAPSSTEAATAGSMGLDVNDVSFLFPLPEKAVDIDKLIPIDFKTDKGVSPLTPALWAELLGAHSSKVKLEGEEKSLQSAAAFGVKEDPKAPLKQVGNWKIVALRYDPCAPSLEHNLRQKPPEKVRTSFDAKACLPQLRLTAQPFALPHNNSNSVLASDFGLHMLFSLTEAESRSLYNDLVAFKKQCGDLTSSLPLGFQPCLQAEKLQGNFAGKNFQTVFGLVKKYATNYVATAMMATDSGNDPWTFMNGFIVNGHFQHDVIAAVHEDDPSKLNRNKANKLLEPFLNGYFQMLSFIEVPNTKNNNATRITPAPKVAKLNTAIVEEYNQEPGNEASKIAKFNSIDNPLQNDFFSTDCASCHVASNIFDTYFPDELSFSTPPEAKATSDEKLKFFKIADPFELKKSASTRRTTGANFFKLEPGYTNFADPRYDAVFEGTISVLVRGSEEAKGRVRRGNPWGLIQFGHREDKPMISQRVANESALAAKMANTFYGQGATPPVLCPTEELRQCIKSKKVSHIGPPAALSWCMTKLCPEREKQVSAIFGDERIRSLRLKKDIVIDKEGHFIPKDTVITGAVKSKFASVFVNVPDALKVKTKDGRDVFAASLDKYYYTILVEDSPQPELRKEYYEEVAR